MKKNLSRRRELKYVKRNIKKKKIATETESIESRHIE